MKNKICIALMAFAALSFMAPGLADAYQTPKFILAALAALPLLLCRSAWRSNLEYYLLPLLIVSWMSAFAGHDQGRGLVGPYLYPFDSMMALACYCAIAIASARSELSLHQSVRIVVWSGLPMAAYAVIQRYLLNADPILRYMQQGLHGDARVVSTQGGPVFLGAALALFLICAMYLAKQKERLGYGALLLGLPAIYFTQTRGAMLAVMIGAVIISGRSALWLTPGLLLIPRLFSTQADLARWELWKISWEIFKDNPWLGYGIGTFGEAFRRYITHDFVTIMHSSRAGFDSAHNEVLQILATMGLIGLAAYAGLAYGLFRLAQKRAWCKPEQLLLAALLIAYGALSCFNSVSHAGVIVLALIFGCASAEKSLSPRRHYRAAALALITVLLSGRVAVADWHYARAILGWQDKITAANHFSHAAYWNPYETKYSSRQVDTAIEMMQYVPLKAGKQIAAAAVAAAEKAVKDHPYDSYAHEVHGKALIIAHVLGLGISPQAAQAAFKRAQELAPTWEPLMQRRWAMARNLGDARELARARGDLAMITTLEDR